MYSWLWAKLKLCQYKFFMVTRRAQDQVKETLKQPYQTTVSIEWLPCLCIDAASYHEVCQKNATTWGGRVDWNLHFHLLKEFHWNYVVNHKATWQSNSKKPPMQIQSAMYMYIYTVFAIAVYLGSTYTLIYTWMKYQLTQLISMFQDVVGQRKNFAIRALRPPIKKQ